VLICRLLSLVLVGLVMLAVSGCSTAVTGPSASLVVRATRGVTQPPPDYVPTAGDAARAAAQQIKHLPFTAVRVDCAPGVPKFPIYTNPSGGLSRQRRYILADGRCFLDSVVRDLPIEAILPEVPSR
jgi:hypothetical protein